MTIFNYIMMAFILTFFGPLGHMFSRSLYFNGSLDKWWLSVIPIFWLPPFNIATYVAMVMGYIQPATGQPPIDFTLFISFFGTLIIPMFFNGFELNEGFIGTFMQTLLMFFVVFITMYIHERLTCDANTSFKRVLMNASIANLIGIVIKIIFSIIINYTPVGLVFTVIETILPIVAGLREGFLFSAGATTAILGTNMYQATWGGDFCATNTNIIAPIVLSIASFVVNFGYQIYLTYAP